MTFADNVDALVSQLGNPEPGAPDRQFEAAMALGRLSDLSRKEEACSALRAALSARQALARAHAAEALGTLGDATAVNDLITALKDPYQLVRSYAARALGKLGDPSAVMPLVEVLGNDPFFGARAEAAEALRNLCPDDRTPLSQIARQAIKSYREAELKRNEDRSRRVLAEMDFALAKLGGIFKGIIDDLEQGKGRDALERARDGSSLVTTVEDSRDRMGGLLAQRESVNKRLGSP